MVHTSEKNRPAFLTPQHIGPVKLKRKYPSFFLKPNFPKLQDDSKNGSPKIGSKVPQKLGPFFSLFLIRLTLSSGQKWFLRPYFPLIRGTFLLRSGLRFSFWALEVPEPRVRKRHLLLQNWLSSPYNMYHLHHLSIVFTFGHHLYRNFERINTTD